MDIFKSNRGFTIVEVLVVVVLIVILSAIAIPSYTYYKEKAREGVVTALLYSARGLFKVSGAVGETPTGKEIMSGLKSKLIKDGVIGLEVVIGTKGKWCIQATALKTGEYGEKEKKLGCIDSRNKVDTGTPICLTTGIRRGSCIFERRFL